MSSRRTSAHGVPGVQEGRQSLIRITNVKARQRFAFDVDLPEGAGLSKVRNGLVAKDNSGRIIAALPAPWAKGASGVDVPTRFEVLDRDSFVQVIDHRVLASYPVIADPWWVIPVLIAGGRVVARHVISNASRKGAMAAAKRAIARETAYTIDQLTAQAGSQLLSFTASNFRENVRRRTGWKAESAKGYDAHHTLPQKYRGFWSRAGINNSNPVFGHWWCASSHRSNAQAFNKAWGPFIDKYEDRVVNDAYSRGVIENRRIEIVSQARFSNGYQCPNNRAGIQSAPGEESGPTEEEEMWLGVAPDGRSRIEPGSVGLTPEQVG